ncbi:MAG TPA: XdhC/CoxI family protein [Acidimicrobiia bacterium]
MFESQQILQTVREWNERRVPFALATVVGVRGSTYRGLAARQLMSTDGVSVGTVSGGCLDQDLAKVVDRVVAEGRASLVEFDLTADDEAVWGWGIGCNGATELLVEPARSAIELAAMAETMPAAIIHDLSGENLGCHRPVELGDPEWGQTVASARAAGRHARVHQSGQSYLIEVLSGPPRLVVCGAGHDAVPLVKLAADLGFEVTVVDDRRQFLAAERFPEAALLVHCRPADLASRVPLDQATSIVIMSHNYVRDLAFLGATRGSEVAYVGCLGPGERLERMLKDLAADGVVFDPDELARLHGPAGLDLGAEGPFEIAWSVLAEVMATRRHASGGSLVLRKGPAELRQSP